MWEKIRVVFTIPELRKKILLTLGLLAVYRIGWQIPLPIVDQQIDATLFAGSEAALGNLLSQVAVFSASQLNQATIFGLGIMPYISASIIFQLLGSVWGPLEQLQKEGESGRKKINEYTRYATVFLCIGQSWCYVSYMVSQRAGSMSHLSTRQRHSMPFFAGSLPRSLTMTAGTVFLMWLGEQIDEFGIGNGISLLIMAGILAGMPGALVQMLHEQFLGIGGQRRQDRRRKMLVLALLFVGRDRGRGVHHARPAAHSHAKRQARARAGASMAARGNICRCGSIRRA